MSKILIIFLIFLSSCSSTIHKKSKNVITGTNKYNYEDKTGQYLLIRSSNIDKKDEKIVTRRQLELKNKSKENILEQSIAISNPGLIKRKNAILRPEEAQFNIWFEGKKYSSFLKIDPKTRSFELKTNGPTNADNKIRKIAFPKSQKYFCFFSQLTECLSFNGFIKNAIREEKGSVRLYLIWDGYPYFQEAYNDLPNELFSEVEFRFDGKINKDEFRFILNISNQSIFFVVSEEAELKKMFWISQGVSMIRDDLKGDESNE
jgi:hypothetical protein